MTTLGEDSYGILAQSIGGGGGNAGWSVAVDAQSSSTLGAFNIGGPVAVGGSGGKGGSGGAVEVANTGEISTGGQSAIGIEAQSVGGGGGNGGWSTTVLGAFPSVSGLKYAVTVGGAGGTGGAGGAVTVNNGISGNPALGAISTSGDSALGILAQSIGGGGGNGGAANTDSISVGIGQNPTCSITGNVGVGGSGGVGGAGSQVTVTNYANVSTAGDNSYGIEAQSVGGGGGDGGSSTCLTIDPAATKDQLNGMLLPAANITGAVSVGGGGGNGNNGGAVSVTNAGNVLTAGMQAYGIFAQSVGGGGGEGGESNNFNLVTALSQAGNKNSKAAGFNLQESVSVGGSGGGASNGGNVTVSNTGAVTTSGIGAYGILAQSVGGGGGSGNSGSNGIAIPSSDLNDWKSWLLPSFSFTFSVGGSAGSSGNGGNVTVTNTGAMTTTGDGAQGIYAQSLGGGGGVATYDQSQMFTDKNSSGGGTDNGLQIGTIVIGGSGGAAGDGGAVQITNSGNIITSGQQACGIYAQSIGGGGGSASTLGGPWHGMNFTQYFGLALNIGGGGGDGGPGGNVTVTDTANITTSGNNSNGIFAQSVGGSGGSGSITNEALWGYLYNGSNFSGASGTGGNVTVTQIGNITTNGQDADGIVAQSTAGGDKAGNVSVTLNGPGATPGNIIANGLGSSAIVAQSLGAKGDGSIDITINAPGNSGLVQGGHSGTTTNPDGSLTTYNAYGVLFLDGNNNELFNLGTINTLDGAAGTAVMQQTSYGAPNRAGLTIDNHGTITGSITQGVQAASSLNSGLNLPGGTSNITVNNYQGATYNAGPVINLGNGTLTNSGLVTLGTTATALTGNFTQTNTGTLQVTLGNNGSCSILNVSGGAANLAGGLQIAMNNTQPLQNGAVYTVLTGNLTGSFSLPANSPLLDFSAKYADGPGGDVQLVSQVNSFSSVAYNPTSSKVAGSLDQLLAEKSSGDLALILAEFQRLDPSKFHAAFDSLTPSVYWAATDATFDITREYERILRQRMEAMRSVERAQAAPDALSQSAFPLPASEGGQGPAGAQKYPAGLGFWMQGFGQWGNQTSTDGSSGYDFGSSGYALGLDHAFTDNLILGANFGYSCTTLNMYGMPGNSDINSLYGSVYGTWFNERSYVESILTYGNHQYSMNRLVDIGSLQSDNFSNLRGNAFSVLTEAGHSFPVHHWNVEPYASIGYYNLGEGAIEETGQLAAMQINNRTTDEVFSEVGVKVERPFHTSKGVLVPTLKAGWQHGFGLSPNSLPVSFVNTPLGMTFPVPDMSQDMAVIRAGLTFKAKSGITTSLEYIGLAGNKAQSNGVIGELRLSF